MTLEIKKYPDSVLKTRAKEVEEMDQGIRELAQDMIETMIAKDGVGLAANQVGVLKRIIAVQTEAGPQVFINPEIIQRSRETIFDQEGCLSLPKSLYFNIKRAKWVEIKALDITGKKVQMRAGDLTARIFQHEIDHIDGIMIINRIGFWQKIKIKKQLKY
ncbi:MAG: peptide deformylase [Patescibacteria group bacterium]